MKIKGLTLKQIEECAASAGAFRLDNVREKGRYILFTLRMARPVGIAPKILDKWDTRQLSTEEAAIYKLAAETMKYRKRGWDGGRLGRWTGAVCFHGHKAFMDEVFRLNPDAVIRTCKAAYLGKADFEEKWTGVGMSREGSMMQPMQYREMCDCYGA